MNTKNAQEEKDLRIQFVEQTKCGDWTHDTQSLNKKLGDRINHWALRGTNILKNTRNIYNPLFLVQSGKKTIKNMMSYIIISVG